MPFLTLSAIALIKVKDLAKIQPNLGRTLKQVDELGGRGCGEYFACQGENDAFRH